jgi:capsular polysaccharide biosynthesis protein
MIDSSVLVAFITGVLGPISILLIKYVMDKRKKKPDMVQETLKVSELINSKIFVFLSF